MTVDVLYVAWNRAAFTEFSFRMLLENTDWSLVRRLVVHDDGSSDGTRPVLDGYRRRVAELGVDAVWDFHRHLGSAPAVMNDYVRGSDADWFAKVDNDIVVPPGWLGKMLQVIQVEQFEGRGVDALGMEAGRGLPETPEWDGIYRFEEGTHMGGVGLIRVGALQRLPQMEGQDEWTKLQHEYGRVRGNGQLGIGWINPDLPVVQLDRVPFDPWASLSAEYVAAGWGRPWGKYHPQADYFDWWPPEARQ